MCITHACADPTQPGVWWREDDRWVRYPRRIEQAILVAEAAGTEKQQAELLPLGQIVSAKYPHGPTYNINLRTMAQTNASSGYSRDVKIVPQASNITYAARLARYKIIDQIETLKDKAAQIAQGLGGTWRSNPHLDKPGSPVYDQFFNEPGSGLPAALIQPDTIRIAFHGTGKENIESILQYGMDPKKRTSCLHRDWYGTHIHQTYVRAKGGNNIIVFALLVNNPGPFSGFVVSGDVITGTQRELALPLGEISLAA